MTDMALLAEHMVPAFDGCDDFAWISRPIKALAPGSGWRALKTALMPKLRYPPRS
jgi:hypothetical protein